MNILAALLLLIPADGELDKARAELKKAVTEFNASSARDLAERIAGIEQPGAIDALLDSYGACAAGIKSLWGDKTRAVAEREANSHFRIDTTTRPPTIVRGDEKIFERYQEAERLARATEAKIMTLEACKRAIVQGLGRFKGEATVKALLKELANSNWQKRAGVAEALGQMPHADAIPQLIETLRKDSEPQVRVALLDALRELKAATPEATAGILEQLKHEFWQVRSVALTAIKALKIREAVEPLIEALSKNDGRIRIEINEALVLLTGVDRHGDPAAWKAWWETNQAALKDGTYKPRPEEAAGGGPRAQTTFYGIPVESKSVIFILDRSGSMKEPSEWNIPSEVATGPGAPGSNIKKEGDRKIDIARWQLKRSLAMLPDGTEFNLIFYSHEFTGLSERMLKLSPATRKQAFDFIDKLDPFGPTNIYDPLEKGLTFASTGTMGEKLARSGVDTIFFLTDGMPNAGQIPKAGDILVKVKELNKTRKVKIHTIGVFSSGATAQGDEAAQGGAFLKQLAEENWGRYTSAGGVNGSKK